MQILLAWPTGKGSSGHFFRIICWQIHGVTTCPTIVAYAIWLLCYVFAVSGQQPPFPGVTEHERRALGVVLGNKNGLFARSSKLVEHQFHSASGTCCFHPFAEHLLNLVEHQFHEVSGTRCFRPPSGHVTHEHKDSAPNGGDTLPPVSQECGHMNWQFVLYKI